MNTEVPSEDISPLPMPIPLVEAWRLLAHDGDTIWESVHDADLQDITILEAREEVVTLDMRGRFQACELDLTPSGADELALLLIRRAEEARAEIRTARWKKRQQDSEGHHSSREDSLAATAPGIDPASRLSVAESSASADGGCGPDQRDDDARVTDEPAPGAATVPAIASITVNPR